MMDFERARRNMVDCQLRTFDVTDRAVLAAMAETPRERFVPVGREELAYLDQTIPLPGEAGEPRFLLAPMVLARLIQALDIRAGDKVLDVGTGPGYSAEILDRLGATVTRLDSDLADGRPGDGPFDAILVNGAVEVTPDTLLRQLADGGRLACLKQEKGACRAVLFVRAGQATGHRSLFDAKAPVLDAFRSAPAFTF